VAALGFLLIVSLAVSAGLTAFVDYLDAMMPVGTLILPVLNFIVSLALLAILFAAIYKVLPDRRLHWRDVIVGAVVTAVLFTIGKSLIGWYLGSSAVASSYGAAGGLIVLLLWVYYRYRFSYSGQSSQKSLQTGTVASEISRSDFRLICSQNFNFRCSGFQGAYHRTEAPSQDRRLLLANHALKSGVPVVTTHGGIFLNVFTASSITSPRLALATLASNTKAKTPTADCAT